MSFITIKIRETLFLFLAITGVCTANSDITSATESSWLEFSLLFIYLLPTSEFSQFEPVLIPGSLDFDIEATESTPSKKKHNDFVSGESTKYQIYILPRVESSQEHTEPTEKDITFHSISQTVSQTVSQNAIGVNIIESLIYFLESAPHDQLASAIWDLSNSFYSYNSELSNTFIAMLIDMLHADLDIQALSTARFMASFQNDMIQKLREANLMSTIIETSLSKFNIIEDKLAAHICNYMRGASNLVFFWLDNYGLKIPNENIFSVIEPTQSFATLLSLPSNRLPVWVETLYRSGDLNIPSFSSHPAQTTVRLDTPTNSRNARSTFPIPPHEEIQLHEPSGTLTTPDTGINLQPGHRRSVSMFYQNDVTFRRQKPLKQRPQSTIEMSHPILVSQSRIPKEDILTESRILTLLARVRKSTLTLLPQQQAEHIGSASSLKRIFNRKMVARQNSLEQEYLKEIQARVTPSRLISKTHPLYKRLLESIHRQRENLVWLTRLLIRVITTSSRHIDVLSLASIIRTASVATINESTFLPFTHIPENIGIQGLTVWIIDQLIRSRQGYHLSSIEEILSKTILYLLNDKQLAELFESLNVQTEL